MAVEQKEIENEQTLEHLRTDRDVAIIEEARKREIAEIEKTRVTEQERRDREIHLIAKAKEEELANIQRNLDLEKAEKDRQIELHEKSKEEELAKIQRERALEIAEKDRHIQAIANDQQRQEAEILRQTAITASEEQARELRQMAIDVGLGFQIWDDYLDATVAEELLGKPSGSDIRQGKRTLLVIEALDRATSEDQGRLTTILAGDNSDDDVAEAILFFCSDRSRMITGETLQVHAGEFFR